MNSEASAGHPTSGMGGGDGGRAPALLAQASPLYAQAWEWDAGLASWLSAQRAEGSQTDARKLLRGWEEFRKEGAPATPDDELALLRRWRRRRSIRVALLCLEGAVDEPAATAELSATAEVCIGVCLQAAESRARARFGEAWDDQEDRRARFCVLALGKLGGGELNFSSDIDLIYCYEGEGRCRGGPEGAESVECLALQSEILTQLLGARTGDGFLYRVDLRLRPEGRWGPVIHPLSALENYYATAGRTWERLALIKARPVAGDLALGEELLDDLQSFRYPRRPPPSLLSEVAWMRSRSERAGSERDVKRGPGGIREVEFAVQALQLLHAGSNPFLQTHSTDQAIRRLVRYRVVSDEEGRALENAYWFLRRIEHRLQMREESQTHEMPGPGPERERLARVLGYEDPDRFESELRAHRERVRAFTRSLFADHPSDPADRAWMDFISGGPPPIEAQPRLQAWFGDDPEGPGALRRLAGCEDDGGITTERVAWFRDLFGRLGAVAGDWARPRVALDRIDRFAHRYGPRRQFLASCAMSPGFLKALGLICDRSTFASELLCAHPEILEEVMRPENLRRRKSRADWSQEIGLGLRGRGVLTREGRQWLWLYLRAEQLRMLIGELLGFWSSREMEQSLVALADAAVELLCGEGGMLVVALGKLGSAELAFGSDLDLLLLGEEPLGDPHWEAAHRLRSAFQTGEPLGPAFALDLRLRPHGDSGPEVAGMEALRRYHGAGPEAGARVWERQALIRARPVCGPPGLRAAFLDWRDRLLYSGPVSPDQESHVWEMLGRIGRERAPRPLENRCVKTGPGSLTEIEFCVQVLQMRHAHTLPSLRQAGTREALCAARGAGLIHPSDADALRDGYEWLRRIELALQRDAGGPVPWLPWPPDSMEPVARWLGFAGSQPFLREHASRLERSRRIVRSVAGPWADLLP